MDPFSNVALPVGSMTHMAPDVGSGNAPEIAPAHPSRPTVVRPQNDIRRPVSIRLSSRERRLLSDAATSEAMPLGEFVRCAALNAAGKPTKPRQAKRDALAQQMAHATGQLGRIGSLANQVARVANGQGLHGSDAANAFGRLSCELALVRHSILACAKGDLGA